MSVFPVWVRAADLIEEKGWSRGVDARRGQICATEALWLVCGKDVCAYGEHVGALADSLRRPVTVWNDAQPDAATVVATLRHFGETGRLPGEEEE